MNLIALHYFLRDDIIAINNMVQRINESLAKRLFIILKTEFLACCF